MSQLNPDAKEFVPVSPTRNNAVSPVPNFNRDVVNDTLVARSPRRAMPMDADVPSPEEFCRGIKQRPSELFEDEDNKDKEKDIENQNQNGHQLLSHQEIMQNLLNGKDPSEIEFHPSNYNNLICNDQIAAENKENQPEGHQANAVEEEVLLPAPVPIPAPQTPELEVKAEAVSVSETEETDFSTFVPRSQDPMSMSFYQDKNEEGSEFNTNPFDDLNKVQMLPDDIEDMPSPAPAEVEALSPAPQTNNIHFEEQGVCELPKSPEVPQPEPAPAPIESPIMHEQHQQLEVEQEHDVCSLPKTPIDNNISSPSPVNNDVCQLPQSPSPEPSLTPSPVPAKSPLPTDDLCEMPKSPIEQNVQCEVAKSPIHIDVDVDVEVCAAKSPMLGAPSPIELSSPAGPLSPKSPIPELTGLVSPDITASIKDENVSAEISETTKSPAVNQTPLEDLEQEHKSPVAEEIVAAAISAASPEINKSPLPHNDDIACQMLDDKELPSHVQALITDAIQDIICEINNAEEEKHTGAEISEEAKFLSEHITNLANEINEITEIAEASHQQQLAAAAANEANNVSIVESEVAPSEVINSFLDRSVIPEVTSPLSPPEKFEQERPEMWKCDYPLPSQQYDIKCETIQPEFPVHTIASPSEESKGNDTPPPTPSNVVEEPLLKLGSPEPQQIAEAVEKLSEPVAQPTESVPAVAAAEVAAVVAAVAAPAAAAAVSKTAATTKKPAAGAAAKKAPSKTSPTSPSKPLASKTTTSITAKKPTTTSTSALKSASTTSTANRLSAAKPKTTTTPTPSPKPIARTTAAAPKPKPATTAAATTASKLAADKKPLTNGDARAPIRQPLVKKTTGTVGAKPASTTTTTSRLSATRTTTTATKPLANGTAKPAPTATKTTTRPPVSSSAAPKPRPASLTSKSTTATSTTKVAPIKSSSTTTTKSPAAKPKTTTTITSSATAPRSRMVLTTKSAVKTADTEKQIKETANKQISASRTSATRTSSTTATRTTTTTLKKAAAPSLSNRTATTTRTTTVKSSATGKKPTEVTRTTITKTKSTPVKPTVEQNGVVNVIQEITTVSVVSDSNDDSQLQLVKDNSPVDVIPIVDNSQLPPAPMEIIAD